MKNCLKVLLVISILILPIGCAQSSSQAPKSAETDLKSNGKMNYVKPTNISGALIKNTFRNKQYDLDAEDAQRLYKALQDSTITDKAKYDTNFFNRITFYDENKKEVVTISAVGDHKGQQFGYQLLLDNEDGKVFTSKNFYKELQDLALRNNLILFDQLGG
jgi:hypothetical protein